MDSNDRNLLASLWQRLAGREFSTERLAQRLRRDGGHDISSLSDADLVNLIEGRFAGDWHEPAFAFSEILACYSAGEMSSEQVAAWVCSVLILADCLQRNVTDMEFQFNYFMDRFYLSRETMNVDEWIYIFERFFCVATSKPRHEQTNFENLNKILGSVESLRKICGNDPELHNLLEKVGSLIRLAELGH